MYTLPAVRSCWTLWTITLAVKVSLCCICFGCSPKDDKVVSAKKLVEITEYSISENPQAPAEQIADRNEYRRALRRGLKLLEGKKNVDFSKPVPFYALLSDRRSVGGSVEFSLDWFEDQWESTGIYFKDQEGHVLAEFRWSHWSDDDKENTADTLMRILRCNVILTDKPAPKELVAEDEMQLQLPPQMFSKPLRVGVITKNGTRSETVDVIVFRPKARDGKEDSLVQISWGGPHRR